MWCYVHLKKKKKNFVTGTKSKTSVFFDRWNLEDIFSCPDFPVVRLDTISGTLDVLSLLWQAKTAWPQFVSVTDGINVSIFLPSHFKDCVAIAICLMVALFFPFPIEVCWLLYYVVYRARIIQRPSRPLPWCPYQWPWCPRKLVSCLAII